MVFHGGTFLLAIYDQEWVIINLSIDLPCSPPVGQYLCSQDLDSQKITVMSSTTTSVRIFHDF